MMWSFVFWSVLVIGVPWLLTEITAPIRFRNPFRGDR